MSSPHDGRCRSRRCGSILLGLVATLLVAAPAAAIDVLLRSPRAGETVFGELLIEAEVLAAEPIAEVEFRVDGRTVGRLTEPPWSLTVDVGDDNVEHAVEVVARTVSGAQASAATRTARTRVDETVDVELQQLYVTVQAAPGNDRPLDRGDFRIEDDGERQLIVTFERGDAPLTAVLLIDTSWSMRGERLATAIDGAQAFLRGLRRLDEAALTLFADHRVHASAFARGGDGLTRDLGAVEAGGGTALNDYLYYSLRLLEGRQGRRVVVVLSDGVDTDSVLDAEDLRWAARRSQAMTYWIRLHDPRESGTYSSSWRSRREHARELSTLERIVDESGGAVFAIDGVDGAARAFGEILTELRSQYVLGYYPSVDLDDGSWRAVRVSVTGSRRVRTRDGYIDY